MNILILTGNFGMGHNSAANAIAERLNAEFKDYKIYIEDLFIQTFKSEKYNFLFHLMVNQGKCLYNFVYRHTEESERFKKLPFNKYLLNSLQELIDKTDADIIISTLWSCSKIVSEYKQLKGSTIPLITCITDVSSHCEWLWPYTDFYLIAAPKLKNELICKGIDPQRIIISGVPVSGEFRKEGNELESGKEKRLLIMGGGLGLIPMTRRFYEEINRLNDVKTTIITGNNSKLYKSLKNKYGNIEVLAYIKDVPRYMKNADLLLSKPGGITVFEAISAELPLLIFPPFLQQESKNSEYILENRIGDMLPDDRSVWIDKIRDTLNDDGHRNHIKDNMKTLKSYLDENALLQVIRQYELECA